MRPRTGSSKSTMDLADAPDEGAEALTLAEEAHRRLRQDIISGAIPAGQPLRLEYLKDRYGISFSPLREALNRLQSKRLVVSAPSRGFRVAPFSEEEMWDVIETRIVIDCAALRRSLKRGGDDWEVEVVASFHALELATTQRSSDASDSTVPANEQLEKRHYRFHRALIAACESRSLLELSDQLYAQAERYRQPSLRDRTYWKLDRDVTAEHRQLLDTAIARDAEAASALLAKHYRETGRMIRQVLSMSSTMHAAT